MIRKSVLLYALLTLVFSINVVAQKAHPTAKDQIMMLKSGALLVRLKTSENIIKGLKDAGRNEDAEKVRMEQEATNKEIVSAFSEHFTFCKIFYFYSHNSASVKAGKLNGVLLNKDLHVDSSFTSSNFLIGQFGESSGTHIKGFFIEDRNGEQLSKPFPFMIKINKAGVVTRNYGEVAEALDNEFSDYYNAP